MNEREPAAAPHQPGETIPACRRLGDKSLRPGNASLAALQAIASADAALEDLSVNFQQWMREEVDRLTEARQALKESGPLAEAYDRLFEASHDLKGQAATLGYPLAADVCASLCRLLEAVADRTAVPVVLVDHHVDAVRAMVREEATGEDHEKAGELADRLNALTARFLARASRPKSGAAAA